ncbi:hypothetical protein GIB67_020952 [Kingdonia uniflora]|uniref:Uncharacterized protein n=1 Tax=Kingdonia uniflora TaxID=39325 RepID=A0A7J7M7L5_9MAGN|nr:hypothetical protein GIB67_020952 [Kingdonia uniflora]
MEKKDVQRANETMVVADVAQTNIVFFNQEEVIGEVYQYVYLHASADQTTTISVEEQTLEVEKTEDKTCQASTDQTTVVSVEEQTIEVTQTDVVISHQEEDVGEASQSKESKEEVVEGKDYNDGNSRNKPDPEYRIEEEINLGTNYLCNEIVQFLIASIEEI